MNIYFLTLHVEPSKENENYDICKAADAHFWVAGKSATKALEKAKFHLSSYQWIFKTVEQEPVAVTPDNFQNQDIGLANYRKAKEHGVALVIAGWSRNGQTTAFVKF